MASMPPIEDLSQFPDTPEGWASRWQVEIDTARKELKEWHRIADGCVDRFLDKRQNKTKGDTRVNVYTANVQTLRALLYGKTPRVDVARRFDDADDDVARVAAEMMERLLNTDIETDDDGYLASMAYALDDRLVPGFGIVKLRYEAEFEEQEIPEIPDSVDPITGIVRKGAPAVVEEVKTDEDVEFDYFYWKDVLWSMARTFHDTRWWAFKAYMTRAELKKRFGDLIGSQVPLNASTTDSQRGSKGDESKNAVATPWARAGVWEIWNDEDKRVYWFVEGYDKILDVKDDPLEVEGFWPFAKPLIANPTTTLLMPTPDFKIAEDLYNEVDTLSTRITLLQRAVKVVGVYDSSSDGLKKMLEEGVENTLVPVDNWALFAEKGGIKGQVDWMPLEAIVFALSKLQEVRRENLELLYQVTGMSDIMRGAAAQSATATEQAIKAKFASVRTQYLQDTFAFFCSDNLRIKGAIIVKHFDDATIIERSNIMRTKDAALAPQAVALLREKYWTYRISVRPESVALTDYAALKQERLEFVNAFATLMQSAVPMMQLEPSAGPFILEMLKWSMAGFKASATIEGVMDQAIAGLQKKLAAPPPPPKPDPKLQVVQAKTQADIQKVQATSQADQQRIMMEHQSSAALQSQKMKLDLAESAVKEAQANVREQRLAAEGVPPGGQA